MIHLLKLINILELVYHDVCKIQLSDTNIGTGMLLSTTTYQTNVGGRQIIVSINLLLEHSTLYVFRVINAFLVSILGGSDLLGLCTKRRRG